MGHRENVLFTNEVYDGQLIRSFSRPWSETCDIGEVFATGRSIGQPSPDRWHDRWRARAEAVEASMSSLDTAADSTSLRSAWLRAGEYYRQAYYFLRHDLTDKRLVAAHADHVRCFENALPLLTCRGEANRVPFGDTTLKAYFFAPDDGAAARPTIIFPCGYDSTAEEGWKDASAAIARGYNAFTFEGPGQGEALIVSHLTFSPDFSQVLTPMIDWLLTKPGVDPERLVLVGRSFAGYLAPQAATQEHRIAALVCDPPQPDMGAHIPQGVKGKFAPLAVNLESRLDENRREFFGSRMAAHGVSTIEEYFETLRQFNMLSDASGISCPTLLIECEGDFVGGGTPAMVAALTCPVTSRTLTAADGAGGHCGGLGQNVWQSTVYPWIAQTTVSR